MAPQNAECRGEEEDLSRFSRVARSQRQKIGAVVHRCHRSCSPKKAQPCSMRQCLLLLFLFLSICWTGVDGFQSRDPLFQTRKREYTVHRGVGGLKRSSRMSNNNLSNAHLVSSTTCSVLLDPSSASEILTQGNIVNAFSVATFLPQPFWFLLILIPNTDITKKIMGGMEIVTLCALVHFFVVVASIAQPGGSAPLTEFAGVFDPAGEPQKAFIGMMQYPNFITEEWSHVLTWDLFVGRWIWLDGLKRNIFTAHSVLLCNLIGPPGLLLHWATCLVTSKGIVANEVPSNK